MSENKDIHSFDYEARARQVLSQKPLLSAKDLEVTFSLRGQKLTAMVEGELAEDDDGNPVYVARTYRDAPDVDGYLFFTGKKRHYMSGDFVRVRVTGAQDYDLIGEEL